MPYVCERIAEVKSFSCMKISGYFFSLLKLPQKVRYCSFSTCSAVCYKHKSEVYLSQESYKAVGLWGIVSTLVITWRWYTRKPSSKLLRRYPGDRSGGMNAAQLSSLLHQATSLSVLSCEVVTAQLFLGKICFYSFFIIASYQYSFF